MKYEKIEHEGSIYEWYASQDSQHPGLWIKSGDREFELSVELTRYDEKYNERFFKGQVKYPITEEKVKKVITALISQGYMEKGQGEDLFLTFSDEEEIYEN